MLIAFYFDPNNVKFIVSHLAWSMLLISTGREGLTPIHKTNTDPLAIKTEPTALHYL